MKWYQDYSIILEIFEKHGELVDEVNFYFKGESEDIEHYIGCKLQDDEPYWAGLCDIPDGCDFKTAKELFEARIYNGKSIKERWNDLVILDIAGIRADDWKLSEFL
jgi:spore coat polysaccharide biosynthesis predicted glycosyltransferase SpsG